MAWTREEIQATYSMQSFKGAHEKIEYIAFFPSLPPSHEVKRSSLICTSCTPFHRKTGSGLMLSGSDRMQRCLCDSKRSQRRRKGARKGEGKEQRMAGHFHAINSSFLQNDVIGLDAVSSLSL